MTLLHLIGKLVYCTGVLAVIIAVPRYTFQWRLGEKMPTMSINYDQMIRNIGIAALLSAITQVPGLNSLRLCSEDIKKGIRRIHSSLFVLPWSGLCCTMFVKNLLVRLVVLRAIETPEARQMLYISTLVYSSVFCLALEMMFHWTVIFFLERDNIPTYIKCPSRDLIFN